MAPTGSGPPVGESGAGRRFGRYVVEETVATGDTGMVLAARDPELDRRVTIHVLPDHAVHATDGGAARQRDLERLIDDGQGLVRLSHPNLAAVHEIGEIDGQVFVVTERVDGVTLQAWCRERPRRLRELLAAYIQAGRGLAALHAAGTVHADFTAESALIEGGGRVRLIGFGAARAARPHPATTSPATASSIAPELLRGQPADARSDQFAFGAALHRALSGKSPYAEPAPGGDALAPFESAPRRLRNMPGWLVRAVQRALAADPDARHPSVEALLAVLEPGMTRAARWKGVAALVGVAAAAALVVSVIDLGPSGVAVDPRCASAEARLARAWSPEARAAVRAALLAGGGPRAAESAELATGRLDEAGARWLAQHRAACDAASSPERAAPAADNAAEADADAIHVVVGRRLACLDQRLGQIAAAVTVLRGAADPAVADRAAEIAASIEPAADCDGGPPKTP